MATPNGGQLFVSPIESSEQTYLMHTYPEDRAVMVKGEGVWLYGQDGKRYLDFLAGIAVVSLGHVNQAVTDAVEVQLRKLWHSSNYFLNESAPRLSKELAQRINPTEHGRVFFCNSGAEANEAAIKLARRFGKGERSSIVAMEAGFHGRTLGALAATGQPAKQEPFEPLPKGFVHVPFGDIPSVKEATEDNSVVAVMVECIQGEAGVIDPPPGYLEEIGALCKERGILLILDEVQTGMCRTGDWFAFHHHGLSPDIVVMAKALGNGFPIGAIWAKDEVADSFIAGDHGSTFGGQALATVAALATVVEMDRLELTKTVPRLGNYLAAAVRELSFVREVSGRGLLIGVELDGLSAREFVKKCFSHGLIVNATGEYRLRLAPPLVIDESHIDILIAIFKEVWGEMT